MLECCGYKTDIRRLLSHALASIPGPFHHNTILTERSSNRCNRPENITRLRLEDDTAVHKRPMTALYLDKTFDCLKDREVLGPYDRYILKYRKYRYNCCHPERQDLQLTTQHHIRNGCKSASNSSTPSPSLSLSLVGHTPNILYVPQRQH